MPQAVALYALSAAASYAGFTTVAGVLYYASVNSALGSAAQALTPTPKRSKLPVRGTVSGGTNPMPLVFGQRRVGGQLCYVGVDSTDTDKLWYVLAHSLCHASGIEDITDVYLDGNIIADANINGSGVVTAGDYAGWVVIDRKLGLSTDTVNATFDSTFSEIDSNFKGKGVAKTYFKFARDGGSDKAFQQLFPNGLPQCSVIAKGIKCYDPRLDSTNGGSGSHRYANDSTWAYTTNPILIAATYAIMDVDDGGCGLLAATEIDWTLVASQASICEESRTIPDGLGGSTTQNRYECHIALSTADTPDENLTKIIGTCAGAWTYTSGKLRLHAGAYDSPTQTITESWLRGPVVYTPKPPIDELYNAVKGAFDNASAAYRTEIAQVYTNSTYETNDGGRGTRWLTNDWQGSTNQYQVQYLQNILGRRSRKSTIRLQLNPRGFDIRPWDTVTVTLTELGINSVFRVVEWNWTPEGPEIVAIGESSSVYTSTYATDYTERNAVSTPALTAETPPTPAGLGVTASISLNVLTWESPPLDVVTVVYASDTSGGTFVEIGTTAGSSYTERVSGGVPRYYKIAYRRNNTEGTKTAEVTATALIVVTGTAPIPDYVSAGSGASDGSNAVDFPGYFGTTDGTGIAVVYPSSIAAGDLIIVHVGAQGGGTINGIVVTTPSGFTAMGTTSSASGAETSVLLWKRSDGTESGDTLTIQGHFDVTGTPTHHSGNVVAARIYRFTGVLGTGTPYEALSSAARAATTNVTPINVTTTGTNELAVQFVFIAEDETTASFTGEAGADYVESATYGTTTGNDIALQLQTADKATAGAITGGTYAIGTSQINIVHGLALKPAA